MVASASAVRTLTLTLVGDARRPAAGDVLPRALAAAVRACPALRRLRLGVVGPGAPDRPMDAPQPEPWGPDDGRALADVTLECVRASASERRVAALVGAALALPALASLTVHAAGNGLDPARLLGRLGPPASPALRRVRLDLGGARAAPDAAAAARAWAGRMGARGVPDATVDLGPSAAPGPPDDGPRWSSLVAADTAADSDDDDGVLLVAHHAARG